MTDEHTVAVLGLGNMGSAMTDRLVATEHSVRAWTRRPTHTSHTMPTPAEAMAGAGTVLLALYDAEACHAVLDLCADGFADGQVVVNTATVSPEEAEAICRRIARLGGTPVHAPVLGSTEATRGGTLTVLVGVDRLPAPADDALDAFGTVVPVGTAAEAAALKLVANGVLADNLITLGTAFSRARRLGLAPGGAFTVLERTLLGPLVRAKRSVIDGSDDGRAAAFRVGALVKDLRLLAAADPEDGSAERAIDTIASYDRESDVAIAVRGIAEGPVAVASEARLSRAVGVPDDQELLVPLVVYARGHASGDPRHFSEAFLPTAHIEGIRDGRFVSWDLPTYCGFFSGRPSADEENRSRLITGLTVTGTIARATMRLWHGTDLFTDEFLLVREDGRWWVANKIYHRAAADDL